MDIRAKRKFKDVLRGIIGDGFEGTQMDLSKALRSRGFKVTQSTISRTMSQIGVLKEVKDGKSFYKIKNESKSVPYRGSLSDLVLGVYHNSVTIVVKTRASSAMFVAGFLDHEAKDLILGTVAGDDTIFIAPGDTKKISMIAKSIESLLSR